MKLYPIFLNIEHKLAVIAGGGDVAYRKLNDLLDCGAKVKIIAPDIHDKIKRLRKENPGLIEIIQRKFKSSDIIGAYIIFAATDDPALNKKIFQIAVEKNLPVNSVDDPENCSFIVPSIARRGDLTIAVSTSGASPAMAAKIRRTLEKNLPANIEDILLALQETRKILKGIPKLTQPERAAILKKITEDEDMPEKLTRHFNEGTIKDFLINYFRLY